MPRWSNSRRRWRPLEEVLVPVLKDPAQAAMEHWTDVNPIERLWLRLKADFFADWIARSGTELEERPCHALNHFMSSATQTASICPIWK